MKVYLITDDAARLDPLLAELERLAVPAAPWPLDDGSFELGEPPPEGVFVNRVAPAAAGSPRLRGLLAWLESYRRRVLNGSGTAALESSRVLQYAALRAAGIPVPRTVSVSGEDRDALRRAARELAGAFAVISNRPGLRESRVFASVAAFDAAVDAGELPAPDRDGVVLLQEVVAVGNGGTSGVTRVEFVGGVVQSASRLRVDGPALPEAAAAETPERLDGFDDPILDRALVFLYSHGVEIAAIELATDGAGKSVAISVGGAAEPWRTQGQRTLSATASLIAYELNKARAATRQPSAAGAGRQPELVRTAV